MLYKFLFLLGAFVFWIDSPALAERSMRIAAVVNEEAISGADVEDRLRLIIASAGLQNTTEIRQKVLPQVINGLVEEQIKLQEASRNDISVSAEEIKQGFGRIAAQNKMEMGQFFNIMKSQGVPKRTLERQIKAQIAWSKVIQRILRPRVDVTDTDIDARLNRLRQNIGKTEFLVSEIFLPVEDPNQESEIRKLAERLAGEIKNKKAPFRSVAIQFSKAPGAASGGSLGWIQEGQLAQELDDSIALLERGEASKPIRTASGFHILMVRNKRIITDENIPPREDTLNQIGLERLDRLQRRYLSDLKAAAFIDRRV